MTATDMRTSVKITRNFSIDNNNNDNLRDIGLQSKAKHSTKTIYLHSVPSAVDFDSGCNIDLSDPALAETSL